MSWALATAFVISIAAIRVYRRLVTAGFKELVRSGEKNRPVANGAGAVLWDVSLLFTLYLWRFRGAPPRLAAVLLAGTFLFAVLGWLDDLLELSPLSKLGGQTAAASISIGMYFALGPRSCTPTEFLLSCLAMVWLVNVMNLVDILDGLLPVLALLLIAGFLHLFRSAGMDFLFEHALFWGVSILALAVENLHRPRVYPGDAGAHLLGALLFFYTLEWIFAAPRPGNGVIAPAVLFSFLAFDFSYLCVRRLSRKKPLFLKSNDHLALVLLRKTGSKKKALVWMGVLQASACLLARLVS